MDAIFKALNDPARRAILDSLRDKDGQTLSDLLPQFDMTRFGVMKHLGLLEEAGLITTYKKGRFKYHYLNAVPLQEVIDRWIEPLIAAPLARGMIDLKSHLEGDQTMLDTRTPDFVHQTMIRCTQDALWDALTRADQVALHHFACSKASGDATATGDRMDMIRQDGSVMLSQKVTKIEPKSRLEMTFEPNFGDGVKTISHMAFVIEVEGPHCKLTCEHYEIPEAHAGVRDGWARYIASMKSWIETGTPIKLPN
ncbi:Transcriptional repressor SdpR [Tritonibacter multivorans]|uniref:Transcriptional repressor SdpR n=2 Tax=Tritonibacter multivorans TaxID=928856 RepID=A0A0N7M0R4_9RHOB|nr:SRPBCC domain-containing protein [Tritonibacter multivorans]CUH81193.1 Transcriptional repressor SdpR [Tritonibacter multivorans]SFC30498.1 transcriptional regulator, ArsR family [Tritonibacter multivorans]